MAPTRKLRRSVVLMAALVAAASVLALAGSAPAAVASGSTKQRLEPHEAAGAASRASSGRVVVQDISIAVPGQDEITAYVVRPAGHLRRHASPGVLFLHWLGDIHNDRTEYLAEATQLAARGVVSVLPQGYFPWVPNPDGTAGDVTLVTDQVKAFRAALNRLAGMRAVDRSRIALVGHDYGAMYGALLADQDHRISAMVLQAPDATWSNWFATYWLGLEGADRDAYDALFTGLDPVEHTSRLGSHVLFQWAGRDVYVTAEVRAAFAASSPHAEVLLYERADHQLGDAATADRDAFLAEQLHLPPAPSRVIG